VEARLELCRRAAQGVRDALARHPETADRGRRLELGEGGDVTMVLDRVAEDAVLTELDLSGLPMTAISEERGELELNGGGPPFVVIDPVDGSLNAKRRLPFHALSIAFATGRSMADVDFGYVYDLYSGEEWWAQAGDGAFVDDRAIAELAPREGFEIVGIETAKPELIGEHAEGIAGLPSNRLRALGSVALSMCFVADARLDGMVSLRPVRSVDAAAAQLIVREAGGVVAFPDVDGDPGLGLDMRSRVAAAGPGGLDGLLLV
jgi:myo-inositol-1(or 4)-monophosphatase